MLASKIDMRDAFFDEVYNIGEKDKEVVFLTDDMDAFSLRRFKRDFPNQFINIGVAEQNMINVSAGLAACGKRVFAYGIASFVTMRCYEQIKVNLASMNLPVTIIGVGQGFSFEFDGPTHHGTQDVAIMRAIPEITIYNLSDISLAARAAHLAYRSNGPVYVRLDKGKFPILSDENESFSDGFRILKPLEEVNIISTGFMTPQALVVAAELEKRSVHVGLVDLYRLKPIDDAFFHKVLKPSAEIVTLEESSFVGGIGSIVCEILADKGSDVRVRRFAIQDRQFISYGSRGWFHAQNGLDVPSIVEALAKGDN